MDEQPTQSDHDILIRIDERTKALHSVMEGFKSTIDSKLDRGAFEAHTKQDHEDFKIVREAISQLEDSDKKYAADLKWIFGVGATVVFVLTALINHFWKT